VFKDSSNPSPEADVTLNVRNISGGSYLRSATGTYVDNNRQQLDFRLRGRQMSLRISADQENSTWRLGSPRVDLRVDGKR